jgi:hypothetical protein
VIILVNLNEKCCEHRIGDNCRHSSIKITLTLIRITNHRIDDDVTRRWRGDDVTNLNPNGDHRIGDNDTTRDNSRDNSRELKRKRHYT